VNLQTTPFDDSAALVIHSKIDKVLKQIAQWFDIDITQFNYRQGYQFKCERVSDIQWKLTVVSGRHSEQPQCIDCVSIKYLNKQLTMNEETYAYTLNLSDCPLNTELSVEVAYKEGFGVEPYCFTVLLDQDIKELDLILEKIIYH